MAIKSMKRGAPGMKVYPYIRQNSALEFAGYIEVVRTNAAGVKQTSTSLPLVFGQTATGTRALFASELDTIHTSYPTAKIMPVSAHLGGRRQAA
jgi:hypothetical protein